MSCTQKIFFCFSVCVMLLQTACEHNYYPKPRGYLRIELPEKSYLLYDAPGYPYVFELPDYAVAHPDTGASSEPYWLDIHFKPFNAALHFTYKRVNNDLNVFVDDAHLFVSKHIPKANYINELKYVNETTHVYGLLFSIDGASAATPMQFYLTDSTTHFVRAALYFNYVPNNDSLAPVIEYLKSDIENMMETFSWRP